LDERIKFKENEKMEKEVIAWNPPNDWVREVIENAGNKIGSVHFNKRSNGELRKMSYRLHVQNPSVAAAPKGTNIDYVCSVCGRSGQEIIDECKGYLKPVVKTPAKSKKDIDASNNQITVLDTNKVVRKDGEILGRGAWRTVPLENVVRVRNGGTTYTIKRDKVTA
jgi:hypothetical protein